MEVKVRSSELPAAKTAPVWGQERVVLAPCTQHFLPKGGLLLVRRRSDARFAVSRRVLQILSHCSTMRTLDEHAAAIAAEVPHLIQAQAEVRGVLDEVLAAGLFITERELAQTVAAASDPLPDSAPAVVCVVTCDRPALLARALESVLTGEPRAGARTRRFFVLDDSRDPSNEAKNRALSRDAAKRHGVALRHLGITEQQELTSGLNRALPGHRSAIDFLLGRHQDESIVSHGRILNYALLLSSGTTLVRVDDDVVCRACAPPLTVSKTIRWDSRSREAAFFRTDAEREALRAERAVNPIASMSNSAGKGLAGVAAGLQRREGFEVNFEGITAVDADALLTGTARVAVTTCGLLGDPGTVSASWLFELEGDSRRHFMAAPDRYRAALRARNLWLGTSGYSFTRTHSLLSPLHALDHRTPLPPFFPLFRGEDYLLGRLAPMVEADAWVMEFPWAVPHLPHPRRRWPSDLLDRPEVLSFARFTGSYFNRHLPTPLCRNAGERLQALGEQIRALGEADPVRIREEMCDCLRNVRTSLAKRLEQQCNAEEEIPPWFQRDLIRLIDVNRRAAEEVQAARISDLDADERGRDTAIRTLGLWRSYGAALQVWPEILAAASSLLDKRP